MSNPAAVLKAPAKALLRNPWVMLAIIVALILLGFWIYRNRKRWWANLTREDRGDYTAPPPAENSARENELKSLARDLYTAMEGTSLSDELQRMLQQAYGLNDTELRIVADEFEHINGDGDLLSTWIDDEVFAPWVTIDVDVIARLRNMGL